MTDFPLPDAGPVVVAVPAPSAALDEDGTFVVGYRVRNGHDGTPR